MTAALEGGEWSATRPGRTLPPGKTRYPFYRRLGGPQGRSGRAENLVPTGIRSRAVKPIVGRYTDWATGPTTYLYIYFFLWRCGPTQAMASSFLRFLDHTQRCTTVGRTPLDEWSVRRGDLYLTTHNTHNRQTFMHPVGFEPTISAVERPLGPAIYIYIYLLRLTQLSFYCVISITGYKFRLQ